MMVSLVRCLMKIKGFYCFFYVALMTGLKSTVGRLKTESASVAWLRPAGLAQGLLKKIH